MLLKNLPVLLPGKELEFKLFAKSFSKICRCGCDSIPKMEMAKIASWSQVEKHSQSNSRDVNPYLVLYSRVRASFVDLAEVVSVRPDFVNALQSMSLPKVPLH